MKTATVTAVIIFTILSFCPPFASLADYSADNITLRVSIADDRNFVTLYIKDPYKMYAIGSQKALLAESCIETKIIPAKGGLLIRKKLFKVKGVRIRPDGDSKMFVDKKPYRGAIDIVKKSNGKIMVINSIHLEDYLYGVLYNEVSHRWPMEVLKAQAIAARTFALYQARQNKLQPYDLRSDIYSQVYSGSDFERRSTTMAVDATRGKVLTYNGDLLPAYFHATCSGATEDSSSLWNVDMPPLDGVACDFCKESPHYWWIKDIPLWDLEKKLKSSGYNIGRISSVKVLSKNKSERVEKLEIVDASGGTVIMAGKGFRQMIGPNELRSTKFDVSVALGQLIVTGRGWGHGVGMCQWGAFGQAKQGKKADEILKYYYPGAEILAIDTMRTKL